jgi:citrate lyase gamma subunit
MNQIISECIQILKELIQVIKEAEESPIEISKFITDIKCNFKIIIHTVIKNIKYNKQTHGLPAVLTKLLAETNNNTVTITNDNDKTTQILKYLMSENFFRHLKFISSKDINKFNSIIIAVFELLHYVSTEIFTYKKFVKYDKDACKKIDTQKPIKATKITASRDSLEKKIDMVISAINHHFATNTNYLELLTKIHNTVQSELFSEIQDEEVRSRLESITLSTSSEEMASIKSHTIQSIRSMPEGEEKEKTKNIFKIFWRWITKSRKEKPKMSQQQHLAFENPLYEEAEKKQDYASRKRSDSSSHIYNIPTPSKKPAGITNPLYEMQPETAGITNPLYEMQPDNTYGQVARRKSSTGTYAINPGFKSTNMQRTHENPVYGTAPSRKSSIPKPGAQRSTSSMITEPGSQVISESMQPLNTGTYTKKSTRAVTNPVYESQIIRRSSREEPKIVLPKSRTATPITNPVYESTTPTTSSVSQATSRPVSRAPSRSVTGTPSHSVTGTAPSTVKKPSSVNIDKCPVNDTDVDLIKKSIVDRAFEELNKTAINNLKPYKYNNNNIRANKIECLKNILSAKNNAINNTVIKTQKRKLTGKAIVELRKHIETESKNNTTNTNITQVDYTKAKLGVLAALSKF